MDVGLEAETSSSRPDLDGDGVPDLQEAVLGTNPYSTDSDADGHSDLEELAGRSDPLDPTSTPDRTTLQVGMYAYTDQGVLYLSSAVYVPNGKLKGLGYQMGLVLPNGTPATISSTRYRNRGEAFIYDSTYNPAQKIVVLEVPIPTTMVQQYQTLNMFAKVDDRTGAGRGASADVASLIDMNGEVGRVDTLQGRSGGLGDSTGRSRNGPAQLLAERGGVLAEDLARRVERREPRLRGRGGLLRGDGQLLRRGGMRRIRGDDARNPRPRRHPRRLIEDPGAPRRRPVAT